MSLHDSKKPIIKSGCEFIAIPLSIIFKKSYNSGVLPHDWKNAQVIPVHKNVLETKFATIAQSALHAVNLWNL